jgi:predicted LPLAT superfamily acyltransferase
VNDSPEAADWLKRQEVGSVAALKLMTWIALHLGRTVSRIILLVVVLYFYLTNAEARQASKQFLQKIPNQSATALAVYRHLYSFSAVTLDRMYFLNGRLDLFDISIRDENNLALGTASSGAGIFLIGAHMGSFESVRSIARDYPNLNMVLLMYEDNARNIKQALEAINPQAQQDIIALGRPGAMLEVKEQLQSGAIIGVLADRSIDEQGNSMLPFLGNNASFAQGPFRMAALLRHPVFFMFGQYHGGNRYTIHLEPIADFTEKTANREVQSQLAMQRYVDLLQKHCYAAPYNWFNFFDFWQVNQPPPQN